MTRELLLFLFTIPVLLFIFLPLLWLFSASISTQVELFTVPPHWIPQHPTFQNYLDIFLPSQSASSVPRTFAVCSKNPRVVSFNSTGKSKLARRVSPAER